MRRCPLLLVAANILYNAQIYAASNIWGEPDPGLRAVYAAQWIRQLR